MIAIIGAMESEVIFYKENIKNVNIKTINNQEFYIGKIGKKDVVITKCGIGKVSSSIVTSIIINEFKPSLIINTGIAGGTSPLSTNDIFIADKYIYGDFDLTVFGYEKGQVPGCEKYFNSSIEHTTLFKNFLTNNAFSYKEGIIITQDSFITSMSQLTSFDNLGVATDMEGASIAHTCHLNNIPFFSIRIISDVIESDNQVINYEEFEIESAKLSSKITFDFLSNL